MFKYQLLLPVGLCFKCVDTVYMTGYYRFWLVFVIFQQFLALVPLRASELMSKFGESRL